MASRMLTPLFSFAPAFNRPAGVKALAVFSAPKGWTPTNNYESIYRELGLASEPDQVVTGSELAKMSPAAMGSRRCGSTLL